MRVKTVIVVLLPVLFLLSSCAHQLTGLQRQSLETVYIEGKYKTIFRSVRTVFQNEGYSVEPDELFEALCEAMQRNLSIWNNGQGFALIRQTWIDNAAGMGDEITAKRTDDTLGVPTRPPQTAAEKRKKWARSREKPSVKYAGRRPTNGLSHERK